MKIYYYPNTEEQNIIFETNTDCVPNIGDTIIIYSSCYVVVKKVFYYNKSTTCCLLYLGKKGSVAMTAIRNPEYETLINILKTIKFED